MRVIAGKYRSRNLLFASDETTRPTTDKVKGAIFNMIGPYFDGGSVLDLFAGSGAIGIEAISRGMEAGVFVDKDSKATKIIQNNLSTLKISNALVLTKDYQDALTSLKGRKFSLIFLDPPYKMNVINDIMNQIHTLNLLDDFGIIVIEYAKENEVVNDFFDKVKENIYRIRKVSIFRKKEEQ